MGLRGAIIDRRARRLASTAALAVAAALAPTAATATPLLPTAALVPATALAGGAPGARQQAAQEQEPGPPPFPDRIGGFVVSIFGANIFSGSNALQVGGALAYFFEPRAQIGFEVEGGTTFGPGGQVTFASGSFIVQAGARTSKIVPYIDVGGGYVHAEVDLPEANRQELERLGIVIEPTTESGPSFHYGGGVRFYLREGIALRADFRDTRVVRDGDGSFFDRLFSMRRIAGMLSFDF